MNWLSQNLHIVGQLLADHLFLSIPPILLSLLISVPLGRLAAGSPRLRTPLLTGTGLLYAIPSLPLFIIIPALFGFSLRSPATMITALTLYGCALLVRGAADAFSSVPQDVRLAAAATGHSRWGLFWTVELPLAGPVLLSSLRVVTVSTVSLVTVGAVIGISSLGTLFTDGFQRNIDASIVTGIVLTVVVAFALDALCVLAARWAMPWQRAVSRA
ncbi:osmoprotectant transport system permease protein [Agrococcus baldri]|uniref:Osmoprotectant transport system permease protein n=1 Tax=Agrococcus baldri TaxID=153730 RepID=A0AA94HPI5_9MICO|nr:ABC transporter permease subunit [Agrococcus baldri]SFS15550.1 osmoprotectant transport system permease protein [Agrococcus baldri]